MFKEQLKRTQALFKNYPSRVHAHFQSLHFNVTASSKQGYFNEFTKTNLVRKCTSSVDYHVGLNKIKQDIFRSLCGPSAIFTHCGISIIWNREASSVPGEINNPDMGPASERANMLASTEFAEQEWDSEAIRTDESCGSDEDLDDAVVREEEENRRERSRSWLTYA